MRIDRVWPKKLGWTGRYFCLAFSKKEKAETDDLLFLPPMGLLLRLIFYGLVAFWLYRQLVRPLLVGLRGPSPRSNFQQKKQAAPPPPEPKIEYRKFRDDEGEYVDYEDVK